MHATHLVFRLLALSFAMGVVCPEATSSNTPTRVGALAQEPAAAQEVALWAPFSAGWERFFRRANTSGYQQQPVSEGAHSDLISPGVLTGSPFERAFSLMNGAGYQSREVSPWVLEQAMRDARYDADMAIRMYEQQMNQNGLGGGR